jgi:hypothetical protein
MVNDLSSYVQPLFAVGQQRWKSYLNQLIAIVQLDPSRSNQAMVYHAVSSYFIFLGSASMFYSMGGVNLLIPECVDKYDPNALNDLIESDRAWRLDCPKGLNMEVAIGPMAFKADCNKFALEGGSTLMAGFEHEFKTGNSTLLIGPGLKGDIGGVINGEMKAQLFLTFDKNKEFADFGFKRTAEVGVSGTPIPFGGVKIGGNVFGVEISDKISINGGRSEEVEGKGWAAGLFEDKK